MAGWTPAILALASFLVYGTQHSHGCSMKIVCPKNEKACACPDSKPKPIQGPSGVLPYLESCGDGMIHYCSVGGECKPEENGCSAGQLNKNVKLLLINIDSI